MPRYQITALIYIDADTQEDAEKNTLGTLVSAFDGTTTNALILTTETEESGH